MKREHLLSILIAVALISGIASVVPYVSGTEYIVATGLCLGLFLVSSVSAMLVWSGFLMGDTSVQEKKTKNYKNGVMGFRTNPWFLISCLLLVLIGLALDWLAENHYELFQILHLI